MSFLSGNPTGTSTPAKPGGLFGTSFGQTSTFGTPSNPQASTAFGGSSTFGAAASTPATGFGAFGTTPASGAATSTAPAFGTFGTTSMANQPNIFGGSTAQTSAAAPTFGGFGTGTATSQAPAPAFGGFGGASAATSSAPSFFGGFGATSTTTTAPTFGGFGAQQQPATGFGGFGTSTAGAFGSAFGKPAATTTVTPGFGSFGGQTGFMMGQPQQPAPQLSAEDAFTHSIFQVNIFGDDRDAIIAKWNHLQAQWGIGKSFYTQTAQPVDITPDNYLCRFKAIGYSRLPGKENKMGMVALNFDKPFSEIQTNHNQIMTILNNIFGNKPNITINVESSKELDEKKSQLVIFVEEKSQIASTSPKRILATDVANFLGQMSAKSQLANFGVTEVMALIMPDEDMLKEYLDNPPKGIDPRMWRQAKLDNPDPRKYIPVPMVGFNELKRRIKSQENETETHALYLKKVEREIGELNQRHAAVTAKILEHKRKLAELSHGVLKILVKQECTRKLGLALTPEEEALRTKLENMQAMVSTPNQFKGRLNELLSQMRMQGAQYAQSGVASEYTIEKEAEEEVKSFLLMQQKAIEVLTDTINKDLEALDLIQEGMPELMRG